MNHIDGDLVRRSLAAAGEEADEKGTARRKARFKASIAALETDPEEQARIDGIAAAVGIEPTVDALDDQTPHQLHSRVGGHPTIWKRMLRRLRRTLEQPEPAIGADIAEVAAAARQLVGAYGAAQVGTGLAADRVAQAAMRDFLREEAKSAVTLDTYVESAGGRVPEGLPREEYRGPKLPGRLLLRLINVVPDRCPPAERTRFYLVATTVLANAAIAAYVVPAGVSVAYPGLNGIVKAALAVLGAVIVGIVYTLVIGHWPSMARQQINPPAAPPPMPGPLRRLSALAPRLVFAGIIVFALGLLLTLAANAGVIAKQAAFDATHNRAAAVITAQTLDKQAIQADTTKLQAAQSQLAAAQKQQTSDENMASCELFGTPRVPGCSGRAGAGPLYSHYRALATGTDQQAIDNARAQVNSLETELSNARAALENNDIKVATSVPTGLSAAITEWNQYAASNGLTWADRNLFYLLLLSIGAVPLGMKLFGGVTLYEAIAWESEWNEAVHQAARHRAERKRLTAYAELYDKAADMWRDTRLSKISAWLESDANDLIDPGSLPGPPPLNGENCTIVLTDVVAFGAPSRNDEDRRVIRQALSSMMQTALPSPPAWSEDRGDGFLSVIPPTIPTAKILEKLLRELPRAIDRHNTSQRDSVRFQLRVAVNVGPVFSKTEGVSGEAIIIAARLVDAPTFKKAIPLSSASLGLIASPFVYENVIRHGHDPTYVASYSRVRAEAKESRITAWMKLFEAPPPPEGQREMTSPGEQAAITAAQR